MYHSVTVTMEVFFNIILKKKFYLFTLKEMDLVK